MRGRYSFSIPFPNTQWGLIRRSHWRAIAEELQDAHINVNTQIVMQKQKNVFAPDTITEVEALHVAFVDEKDYLLFQLKFCNHPFGKEIIREISARVALQNTAHRILELYTEIAADDSDD